MNENERLIIVYKDLIKKLKNELLKNKLNKDYKTVISVTIFFYERQIKELKVVK